jgi:hypothetical protein
MGAQTGPEPAGVPAGLDDLLGPPGGAADIAVQEVTPAGRGARPADHERLDGAAPVAGSALDRAALDSGMPVDGLTLESPVPLDGLSAVSGLSAVDGPPGAVRSADEALVEASGMPPEVAAFLAESASAAGVELGQALRAAGVRSRRRSRTSPDRVQRSFYLSRELVDRARAAVSATMDNPGEAYNVSQLAGRALENEVLRLERLYNGGKRFPPVTHVPSGPSPEGVERIRTGVTNPRRRRDSR